MWIILQPGWVRISKSSVHAMTMCLNVHCDCFCFFPLGLLETPRCAKTYMNLSVGRCAKTLPKANGGWVKLYIVFTHAKKKKEAHFCIFVLLRKRIIVCVFALSPFSKHLMRRLWSATWGVCSSALALEAASKAPTLRRVLRAELRPRASLWTAPRSPWRTVSDCVDASCDQNTHLQLQRRVQPSLYSSAL